MVTRFARDVLLARLLTNLDALAGPIDDLVVVRHRCRTAVMRGVGVGTMAWIIVADGVSICIERHDMGRR
jgi:hypothetical protein